MANKNFNPITASLSHVVSFGVYVIIVAWLMNHGQRVFGAGHPTLSTIALLLLFVLSAFIVGLILLAKPIVLYVENQKKVALELLAFELVWLVILVAAALVLLTQF